MSPMPVPTAILTLISVVHSVTDTMKRFAAAIPPSNRPRTPSAARETPGACRDATKDCARVVTRQPARQPRRSGFLSVASATPAFLANGRR